MTSPQTDAPASVTFQPAPAVARAIAFLIDVGGTTLVTGIVFFTCFQVGFDLDRDGSVAGGNGVLFLGVAAVFLVPIGVVLLNLRLARTRRASVGKLVVRIRLVDARNGGPVSVGGYFVRTLVLAVPVFVTAPSAWSIFGIVAAGGLGYSGSGLWLLSALPIPLLVWLVFAVPMLRGDRRGWQDKAAKSRVVTAA